MMGRRRKVVSAAVSAGAPVRRGGVAPGAAGPGVSRRNDPALSANPAVGGVSGKRAEALGGGGAVAAP